LGDDQLEGSLAQKSEDERVQQVTANPIGRSDILVWAAHVL
jgi:hypothetical protein